MSESSLPRHDWEILVTEGHVIGHRLKAAGKWGYPFALAALIAGVYAALPILAPAYECITKKYCEGASAQKSGDFHPLSAAVWGLLGADPETYTDLGNGQRVSWRLAWLTALPKAQGMAEQEFGAILKAVSADLSTAGRDNTKWSETAKTTAFLTSAPKFWTNASKLATGLVVFPANKDDLNQPVLLTGYIGGQFTAVAVMPGKCVSIVGPTGGCFTGRDAVLYLNPLRPPAGK